MSSKKSKSRSNTPSSNSKKNYHAGANVNVNVNVNSSSHKHQANLQSPLEQEKKLPPETLQAYNDALEDVHTRFILNLPPEELATSDRLFFQLEQAWWYYEDIICDDMDEDNDDPKNDKTPKQQQQIPPMSYLMAVHKVQLPRFKKLQPFARKMFEISPMLSPLVSQFDDLWTEFSRYRRKISTYGTILLNQKCTKVILCQDYNGKAWTFPAGKVNQNERGIDAGARETYEETGFDPNCNLGQTKVMKDVNPDLPWNQLKDTDGYCLRYTEGDGSGKLRTCYVCHGVPEGFPFAPVARKEVSAVQWFPLDNLPKRTFAAIPFMKGLKNWIRKHHRSGSRKRNKTPKSAKKREETPTPTPNPKAIMKRPESLPMGRNKSTGRSASTSASGSRHSSRSKRNSNARGSRHSTPTGKNVIAAYNNNKDLIESGLLGEVGEDNRWSEDDMFRVNEKLIGRKIDYDGNPQHFATKGFDGVDPHAFRVVQGGFMNTNETSIAASPHESKLQPVYRISDANASGRSTPGKDDGDKNNNDNDLQPFFSEGGTTPWDIVNHSAPVENPTATTLATADQDDNNSEEEEEVVEVEVEVEVDEDNGDAGSSSAKEELKQSEVKESPHLLYMREWVKGLPESKPTKSFGDFHFDVDAIMAAMKVK